MESFYQLIESRRTCRRFKDEKIPQHLVDQLIKATLLSPTSKNSRPWEFILIEDKATLEALSFSKPQGSKFIKYAALAIVVLANPDKSDVWIEDASIASIYLQLAAEDLGLGSCWVQIRKRSHDSGIKSEQYIKRTLDIPDHLMVESIIAIGFKDEDNQPSIRPPFDQTPLLNLIHKDRHSGE